MRSPIVIKVNHPHTALCFTENPINYGAIDGKPVSILFMVISPSVKLHLKILSKLSYFLRSENVINLLHKAPSEEEIFRTIREFEDSLSGHKKD